MKTLKTIYSSDLVIATIVDASQTDYKDSTALRIQTDNGMYGVAYTLHPLSKADIDELLKLDDWEDDMGFYEALKELREVLPVKSREVVQPTPIEDIKQPA